jgi:hypothetical protein
MKPNLESETHPCAVVKMMAPSQLGPMAPTSFEPMALTSTEAGLSHGTRNPLPLTLTIQGYLTGKRTHPPRTLP